MSLLPSVGVVLAAALALAAPPEAAAPGAAPYPLAASGQTQATQARPNPGALAMPRRGPVTNLPIPRFVSMKSGEANVRRGPSLSHRIDWVYKRKDLPLEVTAEYGHWRRVRDRDGMGGWVHYSLLSGVRTVLVDADAADLHMNPDPKSPVNARAERGVIGRLGDCLRDWCRIRAGGYRGWVNKAALWGVGRDEVRD